MRDALGMEKKQFDTFIEKIRKQHTLSTDQFMDTMFDLKRGAYNFQLDYKKDNLEQWPSDWVEALFESQVIKKRRVSSREYAQMLEILNAEADLYSSIPNFNQGRLKETQALIKHLRGQYKLIQQADYSTEKGRKQISFALSRFSGWATEVYQPQVWNDLFDNIDVYD